MYAGSVLACVRRSGSREGDVVEDDEAYEKSTASAKREGAGIVPHTHRVREGKRVGAICSVLPGEGG